MTDTSLLFDPNSHTVAGPAGSLPLDVDDHAAHRFLMLLEGQCLHGNISSTAAKYGYCRQRYYQLLEAFEVGGLDALQNRKQGPKSNYRRTDELVRQVLRHKFLDPKASASVIVQKLRQTKFPISIRSVERILADFGLQKKTLRTQPKTPPPASSSPKPARKTGPNSQTRRSHKP